MTINTQKLRQAAASVRAFLKPEYGREIAAAADALDAQTAEIAEAKGQIEHLDKQNERLRKALHNLIRGYVNTLEFGRDRIKDLGGDCDPVAVMEAGDPHLRDARAALSGESNG